MTIKPVVIVEDSIWALYYRILFITSVSPTMDDAVFVSVVISGCLQLYGAGMTQYLSGKACLQSGSAHWQLLFHLTVCQFHVIFFIQLQLNVFFPDMTNKKKLWVISGERKTP